MLQSSTWVRSSSLALLALFGCASGPSSSSSSNADGSSESDSGESGSGESGSGESDSGETGNPQACMAIDGCADDEWCDFPDNLCGTGEPGTCMPRPGECGDDEVSVCGCDGMAYAEPCVTVVGGVDMNQDAAACTPPAGYFACGDLLCDSSSFYCLVLRSDHPGEPDGYSCTPLPDACSNAVDCACLMQERCGVACEATGAGFTVTCPGG